MAFPRSDESTTGPIQRAVKVRRNHIPQITTRCCPDDDCPHIRAESFRFRQTGEGTRSMRGDDETKTDHMIIYPSGIGAVTARRQYLMHSREILFRLTNAPQIAFLWNDLRGATTERFESTMKSAVPSSRRAPMPRRSPFLIQSRPPRDLAKSRSRRYAVFPFPNL